MKTTTEMKTNYALLTSFAPRLFCDKLDLQAGTFSIKCEDYADPEDTLVKALGYFGGTVTVSLENNELNYNIVISEGGRSRKVLLTTIDSDIIVTLYTTVPIEDIVKVRVRNNRKSMFV